MPNQFAVKTYSRKNSCYIRKAFLSVSFDEVCRFCLSEVSLHLIPILQGSARNKLCFQQWIKYIIDVEVVEGDGLPQNSCENCLSMIELTYFFKRKCKSSESKLREHIRLREERYRARFFEMNFMDVEEKQKVFKRPEPSQSDFGECSGLGSRRTEQSNYFRMPHADDDDDDDDDNDDDVDLDEHECTFYMPKGNLHSKMLEIFTRKITKDTEQQTDDIPQKVEMSSIGSQGHDSKSTRYNLRKRKRTTYDDNKDENMSVYKAAPPKKKDEGVQTEKKCQCRCQCEAAPLEKQDEGVQVSENIEEITSVFGNISQKKADESEPMQESSDEEITMYDFIPRKRNDDSDSPQDSSVECMSVSDYIPYEKNDESIAAPDNLKENLAELDNDYPEINDESNPIPETPREDVSLFDVAPPEETDESNPAVENSNDDVLLFDPAPLERSDPAEENSDDDVSLFKSVSLAGNDEGVAAPESNENLIVLNIDSHEVIEACNPIPESPKREMSLFDFGPLEITDPAGENSDDDVSLFKSESLAGNDESVAAPESNENLIVLNIDSHEVIEACNPIPESPKKDMSFFDLDSVEETDDSDEENYDVSLYKIVTVRNDESSPEAESTSRISSVPEIICLDSNDESGPIPESSKKDVSSFDVAPTEGIDKTDPAAENSDDDESSDDAEETDESDAAEDNSDDEVSVLKIVPLTENDEGAPASDNSKKNMIELDNDENSPIPERPKEDAAPLKRIGESDQAKENSDDEVSIVKIVSLNKNSLAAPYYSQEYLASLDIDIRIIKEEGSTNPESPKEDKSSDEETDESDAAEENSDDEVSVLKIVPLNRNDKNVAAPDNSKENKVESDNDDHDMNDESSPIPESPKEDAAPLERIDESDESDESDSAEENSDDDVSIVKIVSLNKNSLAAPDNSKENKFELSNDYYKIKEEGSPIPESPEEDMSLCDAAPTEGIDESVPLEEDSDDNVSFKTLSVNGDDESNQIPESPEEDTSMCDAAPPERMDEGVPPEEDSDDDVSFKTLSVNGDESNQIPDSPEEDMSMCDAAPTEGIDESVPPEEDSDDDVSLFKTLSVNGDDESNQIPETPQEGVSLFDAAPLEGMNESVPPEETSNDNVSLFKTLSVNGNDESGPIPETPQEGVSLFDVAPTERIDGGVPAKENSEKDMSSFQIVSRGRNDERGPITGNSDEDMSLLDVVPVERKDKRDPVPEKSKEDAVPAKKNNEKDPAAKSSVKTMSVYRIISLDGNDECDLIVENSDDSMSFDVVPFEENEPTSAKTLTDTLGPTFQGVNFGKKSLDYNEDLTLQHTNDTMQSCDLDALRLASEWTDTDDSSELDDLNKLKTRNDADDTRSTKSTKSMRGLRSTKRTKSQKNAPTRMVEPFMNSPEATAVNESNVPNLGSTVTPFEVNRIYKSKNKVEVVETVPSRAVYTCCKCPFTCASFPGLRTHQKLYHLISHSYPCEVCYKTFTHINALRRHMMAHTGSKPYKCHICDKNFSQMSTLKRHMLVHGESKPFACKYCDKSYTQKKNLRSHLKIHVSLAKDLHRTSYKCQTCNKAFIQQSSLSRHQKEHRGYRFMCAYCSRSFADSTAMQRHVKRVHDNIRFKPMRLRYRVRHNDPYDTV